MVILWITNPNTREDIPIETFFTPQEALDRKDELRAEYPDIIFFYSVNALEVDNSELKPINSVVEDIRDGL